MRASRLVHILLLLQSRGRMTADELAAVFEVSVRTIYRDVDALGAAGIPMYADRGPAGGYQLMDGYRTRLTGLTTDEAESLFLVGMPGPAADLGLGEMLAAAELKVLASLPPDLRDRAETVRQRVFLDAPGWFQKVGEIPALPPIAQAVWDQRSIRVTYQRWNLREPPVIRTLHPLGLVLKGGAWYLAAHGERHTTFYRVSRVLDVEVLDRTFTRPGDFDLAATWKTWSERFERERFPMSARVRLTASGIEISPRKRVVTGPIDNCAARDRSHPPRDGCEAIERMRSIVPAMDYGSIRSGQDERWADARTNVQLRCTETVADAIHDRPLQMRRPWRLP